MSAASLNDAYVTAAGAFLPNDPVDNDTMETRLGLAGGVRSRYRSRILRSNGIEQRYYALDQDGRQTHLNEELAAEAVKRALAARGMQLDAVDMLSLGTTIPDVLMPGFASMVHGRLGGRPLETHSAAGVCCAGVGALRAAVNAVRTGDHRVAVAGGSEMVSQMLKGTRFKQESELAPARKDIPQSFQYFNADFLRWMLSDGAGALVIESRPRSDALSLHVDWIEMLSFANEYETCMYFGLADPRNPSVGNTYLSYDSIAQAEHAGLMVIRQDTKLLATGIRRIVAELTVRLIEKGKLDRNGIDWFLPHLSSYFFKDDLSNGMRDLGMQLDDSKWFTNLKTRGNTGSASFYIMLEEALNSGIFKSGQKVLAMIPESARLSVAFVQFTVVGPKHHEA